MTTAPEDNIRQVIATPRTTARVASPTSSVPTTPVNQNLPAPVDLNPNMAVLDATQYPMAEIVTNTGEKVMVYTDGPLAGQDKNGNFPIQASAPVLSEGGNGGGGGGTGVPQDNSKRQSAYDLLFEEFKRYGLEALVTPLKDLIADPTISESEFSLKLRGSKAYTDRFKANEGRIGKGLRALSEAEYIRLEDQYQNIMRNYGMPASYYAKGDLGRQEALEKFITADVSPTELEDRIITAQDRVINANPEVANALRQFYPDISNGDILAYALNPEQGLKDIQRKVTAAEIGGAAMAQGLGTSASRAEELARYGVTKEAAQQGFETVAQVAPRGGQLAAIYGESPYTQATAETEIFNLAGSAEAGKQRKKLTELEQASFSKQSGLAQGALARDRAGAF